MKRYTGMLVIVLGATLLIHAPAVAQRPFQRLERNLQSWKPDGRLLRELFGAKDSGADEEAAKANRRTRAPRHRDRTPTRANPQRTVPDIHRRRATPRTPSNKTAVPSADHPPDRLEILVRESKRPEGLRIEKINPAGAAWKAGLRQGDLIYEIGSMKVVAREDIGAIVKVLGGGEQIEFNVIRQGQKKSFMVQLGDGPEARHDPTRSSNVASNPKSGQSTSEYFQSRSSGNRSLHSVLDRSVQPSSRNHSSRKGFSTDTEWQVQPPSSRKTAAAARPNPESAPVRSERDQRLIELQRQLAEQQLEIRRLREQLKAARQPVTQPQEKELDDLLDFPDQ